MRLSASEPAVVKMDITEAQLGVNTDLNTRSPQTRHAHGDDNA